MGLGGVDRDALLAGLDGFVVAILLALILFFDRFALGSDLVRLGGFLGGFIGSGWTLRCSGAFS